ncbi:MAG: glycosyltransferase family 4 protein [Flavobacteriales bacterium]
MKHIILFDQDLQTYREGVYRFFTEEFEKMGYKLIVLYDKNQNDRIIAADNMMACPYSLFGFIKAVRKYRPEVIIQFVWLRYIFLFPFMIYSRFVGKKIIVWSHGINLYKKEQKLMNQFYYLRQRLANALVIYHEDQFQYIVADHSKVFVARNTLNFHEFPSIPESKQELKTKYGLENKKVILSVGRMNFNNRKVAHLLELAKRLPQDQQIVLIGPGIEPEEVEHEKITFLGTIYDQQIVNEYYKLSDVFVMPGGIGLVVNQAFYHGIPIVMEDVDHSPEAGYVKPGVNGYIYGKGDMNDLHSKVQQLLNDTELLKSFSKEARNTIETEASIEKMFDGFRNAVKYVSN